MALQQIKRDPENSHNAIRALLQQYQLASAKLAEILELKNRETSGDWLSGKRKPEQHYGYPSSFIKKLGITGKLEKLSVYNAFGYPVVYLSTFTYASVNSGKVVDLIEPYRWMSYEDDKDPMGLYVLNQAGEKILFILKDEEYVASASPNQGEPLYRFTKLMNQYFRFYQRKQMAEELGVNTSYVSNWVLNKNLPPKNKVIQIVDKLIALCAARIEQNLEVRKEFYLAAGCVVVLVEDENWRAEKQALASEPKPLRMTTPPLFRAEWVADRVFVGREHEFAQISEYLNTSDVTVNLHGMAGVGKSQLVLQLANRTEGNVILIAPEPKDSVEQVALLLYEKLAPNRQLPATTEILVMKCAESMSKIADGGLVIIDNVYDIEQVKLLLRSPGGIKVKGWKIIIASRAKLQIPEIDTRVHLDVLAVTDAVDLLKRVFQKDGRSDLLAGENAEGLKKLAELCGYLPLALRGAAAFLSNNESWSLSNYLTELRKERRRFQYISVIGKDVAAIIALSLQQLQRIQEQVTRIPDLVKRWIDLGILPATFELGAIQAIWEEVDPSECRRALDIFINYNLLTFHKEEDTYQLHALLFELAQLYIEPPTDAFKQFQLSQLAVVELQIRHARYVVAEIKAASTQYRMGGQAQLGAFKRFTYIWPHFAVAWQNCTKIKDRNSFQILRELMNNSITLLYWRWIPLVRYQYFSEGLSIVEQLLLAEMNESNDIILQTKKIQVRYFVGLGDAELDVYKTEAAIESYKKALIEAKQIGYREFEGVALGGLGHASRVLEDYNHAIKYYRQAAEIAFERTIDNKLGQRISLNGLGDAYLALAHPRRALRYHQLALAISRKVGNKRSECASLGGVGKAYLALGNISSALECFQQGLNLAHEITYSIGEVKHLSYLGLAHVRLERVDEAIENYYKKALTIAQAIGDLPSEAEIMYDLGNACNQNGQKREASHYYKQAMELFEKIGSPKLVKVRHSLAQMQPQSI